MKEAFRVTEYSQSPGKCFLEEVQVTVHCVAVAGLYSDAT